MLVLISVTAYFCTPKKIAYEGYTFRLPITFDDAIVLFQLDSVRKNIAFRTDGQGLLKIKISRRWPRSPSSNKQISGINFYYKTDKPLALESVFHKLSVKWNSSFTIGPKYGFIAECGGPDWWYLRISPRVVIVIYKFDPIIYTPIGEKAYGEFSRNKLFVVAFTNDIDPTDFEMNYYVAYDGLIRELD